MPRRALKWLGPGSLCIRHGQGGQAFSLGDGGQSIVLPYDEEAGTSGIIHLARNIAALGEDRIASLKAEGKLIEFVERSPEETERRSGEERRQIERRRT